MKFETRPMLQCSFTSVQFSTAMKSSEHSRAKTHAFPATSSFDFCDLRWEVRKLKRFVRQKPLMQGHLLGPVLGMDA